MLKPGQVINHTYRVESKIGSGGMADVYIVAHTRMPRKFALKVMRLGPATQGNFIERFNREGEILASIRHPHIVDVADYNQLPDGNPYLVMELLEGEDLASYLARNGPISIPVALRICMQIGDALKAAHEVGVVHRDLKPGNIFLSQKGPWPDFVKVLDFGIAKIATEQVGMTEPAVIIGTPAYMSPEQARGQASDIDGRTDQFALAAVLYEMLTGRPAFYRPGESLAEILVRVLCDQPEPLNETRINDAVMRALSKRREDRFPSLQDFMVAVGATDMIINPYLALQPTVASKFAVGSELGNMKQAVGQAIEIQRGGNGGGNGNKRFPVLLLVLALMLIFLIQRSGTIDHLYRISLNHPFFALFSVANVFCGIILYVFGGQRASFLARLLRHLIERITSWVVPPVKRVSRSYKETSDSGAVILGSANLSAIPESHVSPPGGSVQPELPSLATSPSGELPLGFERGGFVVLRELEDNGFTKVYKGVSKSMLLSPVIFHVLGRDACRDPDRIKRFLNSAKALTALNEISHPSLARCNFLDVHSDGTPYMITEFYAGETLRERLQRKGKLSVAEVVHIGMTLTDVLSACHAQKVVHRALSPSSILLLEKHERSRFPFDHVKLLGFSMVKLMEGHFVENVELLRTALGKRVGVGIYMAPEQAMGSQDVDEKADVFVLGMLLSEMLEGKPVCKASETEQAKSIYMTTDIFPLFRDFADPLRSIIHLMTMRSPAARPPMNVLHEKFLMINSSMTLNFSFPTRSIHDISLEVPSRMRVSLKDNVKSALNSNVSISAIATRPESLGTKRRHAALPESLILALTANLIKELEHSRRHRLIRDFFDALPTDEFNALCCDVFPAVHKKFSLDSGRTARVNMILEHFAPEEVVALIRLYVGLDKPES